MSDDETPPEKPGRPRRRAQTATERDIEGLRARAARHAADEASLESERSRDHRERMARRTHPHGVPIPDMVERELGGGGEVETEGKYANTAPWEILDREELLPSERKIVDKSRRSGSDTIVVNDWAKVMDRLARLLDHHSAEVKRADKMLEIIDATPAGKLAARVTELEALRAKDAKRSSNWNWALRGIALLCAGGLLTFVDRLWDRSAHETEQAFRLQAAEKTIERQDAKLERQDATIERLERRISTISAPALAPQHSNKDQQP